MNKFVLQFAAVATCCLMSLFAAPGPKANTVTYEAEFATVSGAKIKGSYVDFLHSTGDYVEWNVTNASGGKHLLEFNYGNGSNDRPLEITVDGEVVAESLSFPKTGGWTKWGTVSLLIHLKRGQQTVRATSIGFNGANIDSLSVTGNSQGPDHPPVQNGGSVRYEAEDADVVGAKIKGKIVDYGAKAGESITWTIEANSGGHHTLDFVYFNGSSDRPLEISVDGEVVEPALSFSNTGGWSKAGSTSVLVQLKKGTHTVTATSIGKSGPNMDALVVTGNSNKPAEAPTPDP